jgi:hypothetical protein
VVSDGSLFPRDAESTGGIRENIDDNLAAAIHVYEKAGYREIEKPEGVVPATMNRFFIKDI